VLFPTRPLPWSPLFPYTPLFRSHARMGRNRGRHWAVLVARNGHFYCPPMGSFPWPPTYRGTRRSTSTATPTAARSRNSQQSLLTATARETGTRRHDGGPRSTARGRVSVAAILARRPIRS